MSKVTTSTNVSNVDPKDLARYCDQALSDIVAQVNGNLDFDTNIRNKIVNVAFAQAGVSQTVTHNLGKIPVGAIPVSKSQACDVYGDFSTATASTISLSATAQATVGLMFI